MRLIPRLRQPRFPSLALAAGRPGRSTRRLTALAVAALACAGFVVAATPASATELQMEAAVFSVLNHERAVHGLGALGRDVRLTNAARRHNYAMAARNLMSHQVPGEASLGPRISRCGYAGGRWRSAGENIGWNTDGTTRGAVTLETMMYNERAPYNGHRLNILSRSFRHVGIDVYVDIRHRKIWLTEDFGQPA
ncbi:MAG: CAP domain-containing protein [Actinomycetota bacterium]|nr:CAP domain-containing protein [Actinomycetota bacterium]